MEFIFPGHVISNSISAVGPHDIAVSGVFVVVVVVGPSVVVDAVVVGPPVVVVVGPVIVVVVVVGPGVVETESVVTITPLLSSLTTLAILFHQVQLLLKAGHQISSRTPQATAAPFRPYEICHLPEVSNDSFQTPKAKTGALLTISACLLYTPLKK
jgi:hypothetical protein